jgi:MFS transporter, DHA2 family, multidrug resistance protein
MWRACCDPRGSAGILQPAHKVGVASGIYKMASSLGSAFGVAISAALFTALRAGGSVETAAMLALLLNVVIAVLSIIAVMMTIPSDHITTPR